MSEMTSVEQQQQQQQQHQQQQFIHSSNLDTHCKEHSLAFNNKDSLSVHLQYHQENLLSQWNSQAHQEERNNNNSKAGNHNSSNHMVVKRDSVSAPADSSKPSSRPPSGGPASSSQQQPPPTSQEYRNYPTTMYNENNFYIPNEQSYILPHNFSPNREEGQLCAGIYARYHPYLHHQRFSQSDRPNSNSSTCSRSPVQCDKCGAVLEDPHQLMEHMTTNHPTSPISYPGQAQYQQIGSSPQHQIQRHQQPQQPQMHTSPTHTSQQQQSVFDFSGGSVVKSDVKQEVEEQAEILDLDSHKVQTHRYEENMLRVQQQQQQELQMHMQHHAMQHQRNASHSLSGMLSWPMPPQLHEYHSGIPSMGSIETTSPMPDQNQFMRGQHMPVESQRHAGSPIITSTQSLPSLQIPPVILQQNPKPPLANQSWKSNEARRPKTYNCTACNKWFTSSGHLKRHYNTTLHKNAVKVSNLPDPANMPISAHHHPGRDANVNSRAGPTRSPELSSSGSPPNLMAGPSGEATRGLLLTPMTNTSKTQYITNNSNSSNSNSSESSGIQGTLPLQQISSVRMSNQVPLNCPPPSPMGPHRHQMVSPSQHNLQMGSPSQMAAHHPMNSPMSPMQHPPTHLNSPSPIGQHHHMSSPTPMMAGVSPMATPPPPMGGTTMPHQPYPNALPPHVTTTSSIQGLMEPITSLPTTGNNLITSIQYAQDILPGFGTFNNNQRPLPSFTNFGINPGYNLVGHNQPQAINVGGLSPEENLPPRDRSYESYDAYRHSPPRYENLTNMDLIQTGTTSDGHIFIKYQEYQQQEPQIYQQLPRCLFQSEPNNNLTPEPPKEELNPNIGQIENERPKDVVTKEHQVTSTHTGSHYISQDGFHKCIECDKVFNKACYLTQHNKSFHSGDKPFKCNQCGKRFPLAALHAEHLQKHAGEKPYKCEICPKQFNHKTDLRRHLCLHSGEKPYACDTCGKGFIRKDHMMKHLETHKKKSNAQQIIVNNNNNSNNNNNNNQGSHLRA